jgi:DNA-binding transcriptional regulator PaaX
MPPTQVSWALLVFTLPREPSAPRVAVWRKLKKLGAALLHDAVWVLPAQPALLEHFRWLAAEIGESSGEALVWVAQQGLPGQDDTLIEQFQTQAEMEYQAILAALDAPKSGEKNDAHAERAALARRYQQIHARDYFHAPTGDLVRARLEATSSHPDTDKGGSGGTNGGGA